MLIDGTYVDCTRCGAKLEVSEIQSLAGNKSRFTVLCPRHTCTLQVSMRAENVEEFLEVLKEMGYDRAG